MKQYLQGIGCIAATILVTAVIAFSVRSIVGSEALALVIEAVFLMSIIFLGYVYKRWNGPLFFAMDGKAHIRLLLFLSGVGTLLGPLKLFLGEFQFQI